MSERVSAYSRDPVDAGPGGFAVGVALFSGVMMTLVGVFQVFQGVIALMESRFYVRPPEYPFLVDLAVWGWVHLVLGALVAVAGVFVFAGRAWARAVGVTLAAINMVTQFLFIPYYPFWALLLIAIDVIVIWALCSYDRQAAEDLSFGV
ncbi:hypothetical protein [Spongiactinospora sp. TRM90649]|uniref:DUF7144 family membrane protein n=1 Tax=Spongiactinospora sp. TRM90649 TaxID=3031114 RepID=UPI0023F9F92E|nr:hypothetical protein [Spongiactinospora sp. TRM90649]MDF5756916.1 hypothetical protein [Spongiactinospora sp. TRM90649]